MTGEVARTFVRLIPLEVGCPLLRDTVIFIRTRMKILNAAGHSPQ